MWLGHMRLVCCSVLQCVAVCCSVVQCGAVCCVVLQCVAVLQCDSDIRDSFHDRGLVCCNVLQCVAVCCSVLQSCNVTQTYETPFMTKHETVSREWVMSLMNASCLSRMSRASHEWVVSLTNESCLWLLQCDSDIYLCLLFLIYVCVRANMCECILSWLATRAFDSTWVI